LTAGRTIGLRFSLDGQQIRPEKTADTHQTERRHHMALYETSVLEGARLGTIDHHTNVSRPDWTKLAPTNDRGRFFTKDTIAQSLVPSHGPLVGGLNSRNVKAPKNGRKAAKAQLGVTGGHVVGAEGDTNVQQGAHKATVQTRRAHKRAKVARNKARRAAVVAELRSRGYAV
jgi:hypothetical protein